MVKVSIMVAVYNAEAYLSKCLDSLLNQTLRDIQILCVDDCSTDSSLDILHDYQQRDNRIEVLHLDHNTGQAHARNASLTYAKGEYITFTDSDDWLSADALQQAVDVFETYPQTDCVLFNVISVSPGKPDSPYPMKPFTCLSGYDAFVKSLTWAIHGVYMTRTAIHQAYPYDETCKSYSNDNTTRIHYIKSREVRCCKGTYYYWQNPASVTHGASLRRFDYLKANESMKRQLIDLNVSDDILSLYENVRWLVVIDSYMFYYKNRRQLSVPDRRYALAEIKRVWQTIETDRLTLRNRLKFGYIPLRRCWPLFVVQEETYFFLKRILGR